MLNYFSKNVGIDLGTANSIIYLEGRGIIVNEPSMAAVNRRTGRVLAVGEEAKKMLGRTPTHIDVIRPLTNGVISDFEMTKEMLRHYLKRVSANKVFFNFKQAVIGVPSNLTEVERKSVEDAVTGVGVSKVYVIDEPVAAALGARLPIDEPTANMIVDIGGGTTEIAVISMGGTVTARSLKEAGDKLNGDILRRGIYLCGGGSMLNGMDRLLSKELSVVTTIVDDPLTCVARGTGILLENLEKYKDIFHSPFAPKDIRT